MKLQIATFAAIAFLLVAQPCCAQPPDAVDEKAVKKLEAEREQLSRRLAEIDAELAKLKGSVSLRYLLPVQDLSGKKSTAARWGLAAPIVDRFSDPNAIVYDKTYLDRYVTWAVDSPTICGAAAYSIATPEKVIEIQGGLDAAYLGRQFRADALIAFLKTRTDGKMVGRMLRIDHPEAVKILREKPESLAAKRLHQSPWERDTQTVVGLLGLAQYKPAYPVFKALLKDPSVPVRSSALLALGRLVPVLPEAIKDLTPLLPDKELGVVAADSLTIAGAAAVPALIEAMNHPDSAVRNRAIFGLTRLHPFEAALPGLLAALDHKDRANRKWALSVVIDLQGRGVSVARDEVVDALARRLLDGDGETRLSAVIALVNLKAAAIRARPALRKAAAEDEDSMVRSRAQEALKAIDAKGPAPAPGQGKGNGKEWPLQAIFVKQQLGKVQETTATAEEQGEQPRPKKPGAWAASAAGDDGRVRVDIAILEDTVVPGEVARIQATSKMLVDGPLRFPQGNHQPLAFLYVRTPAGKVVLHPEKGVSPKSCRALEPADYTNSFLFKKGIGGPVLMYDIPLVNPSAEWLDPDTYEPVQPNFRKEGVYEAWVRFTLPIFKGAPQDAWHGSVETGKIRFTVREMPVEKRRTEATAEQIAHLEAYMKYMDAIAAGKNVELPTLQAVDLPGWMTVDRRLQWALERTENEGFARHVVALLRKHQPKEKDRPYPAWWANVSFFVRGRAYFDGPGARGQALKIIGPYLDDYATVATDQIEHDLADPAHRSFDVTPQHLVNLLVDFLAYKPKSPIRQRLETIARRHARIPANAKPEDRNLREQLVVAWKLLYALDILQDGILLTEARDLLGEPVRRGDVVDWNYGTGSRRQEIGVSGKVVREGKRETIVFTNKDQWVPSKPGGPREEKQGKEKAGPDSRVDWIKPKDGVVGLHLRARTEPLPANESFVLVALVRNLSDKPISVLKPFSGPFVGMPLGLDVTGPKGQVKYRGPEVQPRAHLRSDFVHLEPGQILEDEVALDMPGFAVTDVPGEYSVRFKYSSENITDKNLRNGLWSGTIEAGCKARRVAEAAAPLKAGTPITVTKTSIRFDPKTCVLGPAGLAWGLGADGVNVLGREGGYCVFDYITEVEGGHSTYRCRVPVDGPPVTLNYTGSGIERSFSLKEAHVLHHGNFHLDLRVVPGPQWYQRGVPKSDFVNYHLDEVTGTGAEAIAGSQVKIRYSVYRGNSDIPLLGAYGKTMEFRLGNSDTDAGLQVAVQGMKVGGRRAVRIRQEVLPALSKALGGLQTGTQVSIRIELLEVK